MTTHNYAKASSDHYDKDCDVMVSVEITVRYPETIAIEQEVLDRIAATTEEQVFDRAW